MKIQHYITPLILLVRCDLVISANLPNKKNGLPRHDASFPIVVHKDIPIAHALSSNNPVVGAGGSSSASIPGSLDKLESNGETENDSTTTEVTIPTPKLEAVTETGTAPDDEETPNIDSTLSEETASEPNVLDTISDIEVIEEMKVSENTSAIEVNIDSDHKELVPKTKKKGLFRKKQVESGSAASIAKTLKNRNNLNIKRKLIHVGFGAAFAALNHALPRKLFLPMMYAINTGSVIVESLRYKKGFGFMNKMIHAVVGSSLRKHEMEGKFTGSLYYFSGVTLSTYLFPKTATTLGIWQLALADPSASYFGRRTRHVYWSRIENGFFGVGRNKGLLGFVGGALVCFPFNYRVLSVAKWGPNGVPGGKRAVILASLALGIAGSLADLAVPTPAVTMPSKCFGIPLPPLSIDDNFVVPVVSGFACMKIFNKLGWSHDMCLAKYILF